MIKNLLLIFFTIFICCFAGAQQQTQTETAMRQVSVQNGVVIYESGGMEGFQPPVVEPPVADGPVAIVKPISEWDLQFCNENLYFLEQKLIVVTEEGNEESIQRYQQIKIEILARKAILTNQNQGE